MNLYYMSEIVKDYCCSCTDSVVLDLYSSTCALQKLDFYLIHPLPLPHLFQIRKIVNCTIFPHFQSQFLEQKSYKRTWMLSYRISEVEKEQSITKQSLAYKDALTYQTLSLKFIKPLEFFFAENFIQLEIAKVAVN